MVINLLLLLLIVPQSTSGAAAAGLGAVDPAISNDPPG